MINDGNKLQVQVGVSWNTKDAGCSACCLCSVLGFEGSEASPHLACMHNSLTGMFSVQRHCKALTQVLCTHEEETGFDKLLPADKTDHDSSHYLMTA